jgi:TPR repeat protein
MAVPTDRAGLLPALGAVLLTLFAVSGSVGFLAFQGKEQERFLAARSTQCSGGAAEACDALRSLCLKRDPDACVALADAHLAVGPNHDAREAARLLGEACGYRHPRACERAGRMALEGGETSKDLPRAKDLLDRGCKIGEKEACTLRQAIP